MKENLRIIMYRISIMSLFLTLLVTNIQSQAQDTTETVAIVEEDEGLLPVRNPWTTGLIIDNQTTEVLSKGAFEFAMHHRFGTIENIKDIYGIYSYANTRLGVTYGLTKKISIGFGTEKDNKLQEFTGKYNIISQTRNGKIPLSITYFGNIVIDARKSEFFGFEYKFVHRLSYFNQLIFGRKFTDAFSFQLAGSYAHFNLVTELSESPEGEEIAKWNNDYIGITAGSRYKIINNLSAIVEYCHSFELNELEGGQSTPKPDLGFGIEIGTSTHAFQLFASNYFDIVAQNNYGRNLSDMTDGGWRFGFNIIVRF